VSVISSKRRVLLVRLAFTAALLLCTQPAYGQAAGPQRATRVELEARATLLEQQVSGNTLRGDARTKAVAEAAAIRLRLREGDFKVGDRFLSTIRVENVQTDTLVIRDSLMVSVLSLPDLQLTGTLRSELEERLGQHVARFVRNASVRAVVLTRINVSGAVQRPGIYYVEPARPIIDVITIAGGPAAQARLDRIEVRRGGTTLLEGKASDKLVKAGGTIELADVRSGDDVFVPTKRKINWGFVLQMVFVFTSLLFGVLNFLRWYYNRDEA
jgi:hypothetical protein